MELGVFLRWFKVRVEDESGLGKKARFDDWRRPHGIFCRLHVSKD